MRESQEIMLHFVKIVERFPVLYDNKMPHRTQVCMEAWEKVAEAVRHELHEECSVDELRIKWKGIRSSFTRFKKKLYLENKETNSKQYYLYQSLKFLHAHTRPKWFTEPKKEDDQNDSENEDEWVQNITMKALKEGVQSAIKTYGNSKDPLAVEKKPTCLSKGSEVGDNEIKTEPTDDYMDIGNTEIVNSGSALKRKITLKDTDEASSSKIKSTDESTDLQFFKSVIPDIAHFTTQEKRKFKMGVLKLIDDIEKSRKNQDDISAKLEFEN